MKRKKPSIRKMLLSCRELGPDDGLDPRLEGREPTAKVTNRKALQLCGQVARTLQLILGGECGDAVLRELLVQSVVPAPNSSRLLVTVALATPAAAPPEEVLRRLHNAHGLLRQEVAAAVHRRRVPDLTFRLVGPAGPDPGTLAAD
jgi:ribosome-binding factor A